MHSQNDQYHKTNKTVTSQIVFNEKELVISVQKHTVLYEYIIQHKCVQKSI